MLRRGHRRIRRPGPPHDDHLCLLNPVSPPFTPPLHTNAKAHILNALTIYRIAPSPSLLVLLLLALSTSVLACLGFTTMPLKLREVSPLPPFTFAPPTPTSPSASVATPPANNPTEFILAKDQSLFGAHPLQTERGKGLLRCNKCGKVVTEAAASEHKRTSLSRTSYHGRLG